MSPLPAHDQQRTGDDEDDRSEGEPECVRSGPGSPGSRGRPQRGGLWGDSGIELDEGDGPDGVEPSRVDVDADAVGRHLLPAAAGPAADDYGLGCRSHRAQVEEERVVPRQGHRPTLSFGGDDVQVADDMAVVRLDIRDGVGHGADGDGGAPGWDGEGAGEGREEDLGSLLVALGPALDVGAAGDRYAHGGFGGREVSALFALRWNDPGVRLVRKADAVIERG